MVSRGTRSLESELDSINRELQTAIWDMGHAVPTTDDWERLDYEIARFKFNVAKMEEALLTATSRAIRSILAVG